MKRSELNGYKVEISSGNSKYSIDNIGIIIEHPPIELGPFPQPAGSAYIIGDFSELGLPNGDRLDCNFYKDGHVFNGYFYYNQITKTIELSGALTMI